MFKLRVTVCGMSFYSDREYPIEDVAYAAERLGTMLQRTDPYNTVEVVPAEDVRNHDVGGGVIPFPVY